MRWVAAGSVALGMCLVVLGGGLSVPAATPEPAVVAHAHPVTLVSVDRVREFVGLQATPKPPTGGVPATDYRGNDTCQWANDGECDDPRIGTGFCAAGTDYTDCWRIATGVEDDTCQWANDGECDEPHFGTGACAQATDRTDCGNVAYLRFQTDFCPLAFNGVCNEPGTGDGACEARTDRADCLGRDRPMQIADHFGGHDDRQFMDTAVFPWSVIGEIAVADGACTATLVAPDVIVTAAHCIHNETGAVDARGTFETAFARTGGSLSARVTAYLLADTGTGKAEDDSEIDWALLRIDRPLGTELGFLGPRSLSEFTLEQALAQPLYQAGYSWDTGANLSGNVGCHVLALTGTNMMRHDCDTTHGDSGSPIMIMVGDTYYIVATDSAFDYVTGQPVINVATRSDPWAALLADFAAGRIGVTIGGVTPPVNKGWRN